MKKAIKWIFIVIIIAILAIDGYGVWKYKFKGTQYVSSTETDQPQEQEDINNNQNNLPAQYDDSNIEYEELSSSDFWGGEKIFITSIEEAPGQNVCTLKGLIYEEYSISWQEYNEIKNEGGNIEIFGISYVKDKIQANNLMLKSENPDETSAESYYFKYNASTKKYVLKDSTTDYNIYRSTDKYVATDISSNIPFIIQKNNKSEKLTVGEVVESHQKTKPPEDQVKINYSTLDFSRQGDIIKITELNL